MTFLSQFESLHEQASKATGWNDFGPADYIEPLKLLLSDYDKHTRFNPLGEQMACGQIVGLLIARLFTQHGFKEHPEFTNPKIEKPIIMVGMARTGSTSLQHLLSKDPDCQWLANWLGNTPMPRPPRETWEANPWFQATKNALDQFYEINPQIKTIHPMSAEAPDECRVGIEHSFWSAPIAFMANIPEYAEWVISADVHAAYQRYRNILGLIACGDTRRWMLKDPCTHLWMPQTMLDTFPDALIVYTHRDPLDSVSSASSMLYKSRVMREPDLTTQENGRYQLKLWGQAMAKTANVLGKLDPSRVCHVHVRELNADPVATAERIYRHFNLPISDDARKNWKEHAAGDPHVGHRDHHHKIDDCGFGAKEVYATIGAYGDIYQQLYGKAA
jgi:hypothetical protein